MFDKYIGLLKFKIKGYSIEIIKEID